MGDQLKTLRPVERFRRKAAVVFVGECVRGVFSSVNRAKAWIERALPGGEWIEDGSLWYVPGKAKATVALFVVDDLENKP